MGRARRMGALAREWLGQPVLQALILAMVVGIAQPSSASAQQDLDEVELHDGTVVRGTVLEDEGDTVTVQLPSGDIRSFSVWSVVRVDRSVAQDAVAAPPAPEALVRVHVRALHPGLELRDAGEVVCVAPCDVSLRPGAHFFAMGWPGQASAIARARIAIEPDLRVDLDYASRGGLRAFGWVLLGLASVGLGVGVVDVGFLDTGFLDTSDPGVSVAVGITSGVFAIVGMVLAGLRDTGAIVGRPVRGSP